MDSNRDISEISTNKDSAGFPGSGSSGGGSGGSGGQFDSATLEERQLLGRYGVWLLVGLCTPNQDTSIEILGRLLSMLFHWFHVTAYSFDGTKKSLMHLIFSVGNLTLRIFYTLNNQYVERRWEKTGWAIEQLGSCRAELSSRIFFQISSPPLLLLPSL